MDRVGAIILAAGLSRRMQERNKLLLPIAGVPMIRHMVQTYLGAVNSEICVVTGYEAERVKAVLSDLPIRLVHNDDFEKGQPFSVRVGLENAPQAEHFLIGLGDQPQLTASDLRTLIAAHLAGDKGKISIPFRGETRGNPIVIPACLRSQLLADKVNPGCGKFTRANPDLAQHISLSQPGFFEDIDTPAAFSTFQKMTSQGVPR